MGVFQPIKLSWHGKNFTVPAERVLGAIASIEEVATFPEIVRMINGTPNLSKIARAYGAVLRYAGAVVDDEEVYEGMFQPGSTHMEVLTALNTMVAMMMPPSAIAGAASEGNLDRAKTARSRLSKRSSKRRSAAAG